MCRFVQLKNNPFLQDIRAQNLWTVSDADKRPLNFTGLENGSMFGAKLSSPDATVSFDHIYNNYPYVQNMVYYLNASVDGLMVLDIEKTCPKQLSQVFLQIPALYAEFSLSGLGYHLIYPLPPHLADTNTLALSKPALRDPKGRVELLVNHWVTFTGNICSDVPIGMANDEQIAKIWNGFARFAKQVKRASIELDPDLESLRDKLGANLDTLIKDLIMEQCNYGKTLDDFDGDLSRFTFGYFLHGYRRIREYPKLKDLSQSERIAFMCLVARNDRENLTPRPKWDEPRNPGGNWLAYTAGQALAVFLSD